MRYLFIVLAVGAVLAYVAQSGSKYVPKQDSISASHQGNGSTTTSSPFDGVYEFVSRTTTIDGPPQNTEVLVAPDWYGLWIFHDGYFSQTRMQNIRADWTPAQFPSNPQGLGFDGASGTFVTKEDVVKLDYMVNFYPGRVGATEDLKYSFENDTLTLTWRWLPGHHHSSKGQRVTVLRKIK